MKALVLIVVLSFYTTNLGSKDFDISECKTITVDRSIDLMKDVAGYYSQDYQLVKYIFDICGQFNIDPLLLIALIRIESNFRANAVSKSDAVGYCQIRTIAIKDIGLDLNRYNHKENIMIGAIFLSKLIKRYNNDIGKALIHYNAGTQKSLAKQGEKYAGKVIAEYQNISILREKYI